MSGAPLTRRALLSAGLAMAGMGWLSRLPAWAEPSDLAFVTPRSKWGGDLPPTGALEAEAAGDVRFLLIHHSASPNAYAAGDVPGLLRSFYGHHTDAKGWPDVAYNFFVDRFGGVWEGRTGSLGAPIKGDATGGSQGHALLVCLVGDHTSEAPTDEAVVSLVRLLAVLADRHGIDPSPGSQTTFVSRGSNRWIAGSEVTTATIAGHRDMSSTSCPGDAAYRLVTEQLPALVVAASAARGTRRSSPEASEPEPASPAPGGEAGDADAVVEDPVTRRPQQSVPPPPQPGVIDVRPPGPGAPPAAVTPARGVANAPAPDGPSLLPLVTGVAGAALTAAGSGAYLHRRRRPEAESWSSAQVPPPRGAEGVASGGSDA